MKKKCKVCGKEFEPRVATHETCSTDCCYRRKLLKNRKNVVRKCLVCGIEFVVKHGPVRTCSEKCRQRRADRTLGPFIKKCLECGETFIARGKGAGRRVLCGRICRKGRTNTRQRKNWKWVKRDCAWCGREFTPGSTAKTCSQKCRQQHEKRVYAAWSETPGAKERERLRSRTDASRKTRRKADAKRRNDPKRKAWLRGFQQKRKAAELADRLLIINLKLKEKLK